MQQYAIASLYPRSIAWLAWDDDWDWLEKIVKYNCAILGGYFNIIVPVKMQDHEERITEDYMRFMVEFDPDLIVLAPGMTEIPDSPLLSKLNPFDIIRWDNIDQIVSLDPWSIGSGMNSPPNNLRDEIIHKAASVAVTDMDRLDFSRLALVACGDVEPREPIQMIIDGEIDLDATGYRENVLSKLVVYNPLLVQAHKFFIDKILKNELTSEEAISHPLKDMVIDAPDRKELANLVSEGYQFPLYDAVKILDTCCELQTPPRRWSFIGQTTNYKLFGGTPRRHIPPHDILPGMVILISDHFSVLDSILFWNLRANEVYVAWLSFSEFEANFDAIVKWLNSDRGGRFFAQSRSRLSEIIFSSTDENRFIQLCKKYKEKLLTSSCNGSLWHVKSVENLIFYDYIRPRIRRDAIMVITNKSKCSFIPKRLKASGIFCVTLEWNGLMLPLDNNLVNNLISSEVVKGFSTIERKQIRMPRFRIDKNRFLRVQTDNEFPIEFYKPTPDQIVEILFMSAGFDHVERSSTAKYHMDFIKRTGSLEEAARYLITSPYREIFDYLSDNRKENNKIGLVLKNPDKRRVLHHLHILQIFGYQIPSDLEKYFDTISDELPIEIIELLDKQILNRGFLLKCDSCSFTSWYPAEHLGQDFECSRCYQTQVCKANPLWLYKLSEVTFQGFENDMIVPILALNYLKHISQHCFEWVPDLDVYWTEGSKMINRNIDILCISDGRFLIGEAKSNDNIPDDQFSFYEDICKRLEPDGIVFATSKSEWKQGTKDRIETLKEWFSGKVFVLTYNELYSL